MNDLLNMKRSIVLSNKAFVIEYDRKLLNFFFASTINKKIMKYKLL